MVRFSENEYVIEVSTAGHPAEDYTEAMGDLVDLLQSESEDMRSNRFYLLELLKAMLPSIDQAKQMFKC